MKTVSGPRWGCLYPLYICLDAILGATNTCLTPDDDMSCPQVSLYDVSIFTQNVLFHDEHQYGGNDENRLRTSVGVFISFVCWDAIIGATNTVLTRMTTCHVPKCPYMMCPYPHKM
jgi:hypothetical protein